MVLRETKKPVRIIISTKRKEQLDDLLSKWDFETKEFIRGILKTHLNTYFAKNIGLTSPIRRFRSKKAKNSDLKFISDPEVLRSWEKRYEITGEKSARKSFEKILKKELSYDDTVYLTHCLNLQLSDVVVPDELVDLLNKTYIAHLRKELSDNIGAPKKPFILVVGPTGAGKTHTIKGAVELGIFNNELRIIPDYKEERERLESKHPFLSSVPFLRLFKSFPELDKLEKEEEIWNKIKRYKRLKKITFGSFKRHIQKKITKLEKELEEISPEYESLKVDYDTISPNQIQTMWYGETGNKFEKAMGKKNIPSIRHLIEAHGILRKPSSTGRDVDVQSTTLSATVNKIMDEITDGERDCIFIADTHSPEEIASDTYRRFDEQGVIIDMSKYWRDKRELKKLIILESYKNTVKLTDKLSEEITDKIFEIFNKKNLTITPAYVRKLVASIIEVKGDIKSQYFDDELLIRKSFENVARNLYGKLYKKVVKNPKISEGYGWDDYVGSIKEDVLEKISSALFYGGDGKGVVLAGPPGSGKTFLASVIAATHPEISYISVKMDDLQEEGKGLEGIIENIDAIYNIGKMLAPSMIVINEGDAVLKRRSEQGSNPYDKVTNKFLDLLDGEESIKGTYTIVTTNLLENLDPAIHRPGRLDILSVEGKLGEKDIYKIIDKELKGEAVDEEVTYEEIYKAVKSINNVPAGYVDFVRRLKSLRKIEFGILREYKKIFEAEREEKLHEFMKFNAGVIIRLLESTDVDQKIILKAKKDPVVLFNNPDLIYNAIKNINKLSDYKIKRSHIKSARSDLLKNPSKRALKGLDEFLSEELSIEPQVGKVIGAAYGNNIGLLVPINTNIISPKADGMDVIVTGVTRSSALQQTDYSEMTTQSAREALTLNLHYFQKIFQEDKNLKDIDVIKIIGLFLKDKSIHHQMESVNYMGGGPSAGFALSINTLSVLLNLPVYNDFGITGAPGTKGVSKDKVGSSVMIGGEDKKSERVLRDLQRMYVPKKNYHTIPTDVHESYWNEGKIVIPVGDYREIIPEVIFFGEEHDKVLKNLIAKRISYNKKALFIPEEELSKEKSEIEELEQTLKTNAEEEIKSRLNAIHNFYKSSDRNEFLNLDAIFKNYK